MSTINYRTEQQKSDSKRAHSSDGNVFCNHLPRNRMHNWILRMVSVFLSPQILPPFMMFDYTCQHKTEIFKIRRSLLWVRNGIFLFYSVELTLEHPVVIHHVSFSVQVRTHLVCFARSLIVVDIESSHKYQCVRTLV